jgi:hypothetical protein
MMRSALQIKLASETIADQQYHFEAVGFVDRAFVRDDYLPGIAIRPYQNRHIRGRWRISMESKFLSTGGTSTASN